MRRLQKLQVPELQVILKQEKDLALRQNLQSLREVRDVLFDLGVFAGKSIPSSLAGVGAFWAPKKPLKYSAMITVE